MYSVLFIKYDRRLDKVIILNENMKKVTLVSLFIEIMKY